VRFCDGGFDANREASCVRQLIDDGVSAILAPQLVADTTGRSLALAERSKVALLGGAGLLPPELNSPAVFPLSSGIPGWVYGSATNTLATGARKIALVGETSPASEFIANLSAEALRSAGVEPLITVLADPQSDPTMVTAAAKAVATGADAVMTTMNPPNMPKIVRALHQTGFTGVISSISTVFPPEIISALGPEANGILITSQIAFTTDRSNPAVAAFHADLDTFAPDAKRSENALNAWSSTQLFAALARTLPTVDAATVFAGLNDLDTPLDIGVTAPFAVKGAVSPLPQFPRIVNRTVVTGSVVDGVLTPSGKGFIDPFQELATIKK
jgi:branched-chain amino acid transport system substrate-binding protein